MKRRKISTQLYNEEKAKRVWQMVAGGRQQQQEASRQQEEEEKYIAALALNTLLTKWVLLAPDEGPDQPIYLST